MGSNHSQPDEQSDASLALGYERIIGAGVLCDDNLPKRSAFALEQADDAGEQPDRDQG